MSRIIHGAALSPFVRKTCVMHLEKGLDYELNFIDPLQQTPEWFNSISPLKRIPAFEDNGKQLADSAAIGAYLEKAYPEVPLYPADPHDYGRAIWFERYGDYELAPQTTFGIFRNKLLMPLMGKEPDWDIVSNALEKELPPMLNYLQEQLGEKDFLVGDSFSIADIAIATQFVNLQHGGECIDPAKWPALAAYITRMHSRDSFSKLLETEQKIVDKIKARNG